MADVLEQKLRLMSSGTGGVFAPAAPGVGGPFAAAYPDPAYGRAESAAASVPTATSGDDAPGRGRKGSENFLRLTPRQWQLALAGAAVAAVLVFLMRRRDATAKDASPTADGETTSSHEVRNVDPLFQRF